MSAIVGIYNFNQESIAINQMKNIMDSFQRYPADDIQVWKKNNVFLGCHAQWITPESVGEIQPYYDYDRQLVITADAIIDNRNELCEKLRVDHELRQVIPDCRLLLLAYDKWGEDVPMHLIGDFAFMIWDEKKQTLFGARDFSGSRTLYFYHDSSRIAFSTTIQPLFTLPYIEKKLNEEWMAEFLAMPTMAEAVDMKSTPFQSITQVPPSHSMTVVGGKIKLTRYCTIEVEEELRLNSNEEYEEAFREVFQKAVKARTRTHGQVGSHLSGGLDSGSVVSFAAKELKKENKQLHTFSYLPEDSFKDWTPKYFIADESPYIKETVSHVGNISDNYMSFEGKDPLSEVDDFLDVMEMPYKFFENSFWLKEISELAQQKGIKILLNGARGNNSISWGSWDLNMEYYTSLLKKLRWIKLYRELDDYTKNFNTGKSTILPMITKRALPTIPSLFRKNQTKHNFPLLIHSNLAKKTKIVEKLKDHGVDLTRDLTKSNVQLRKDHYKQLYHWNKSGTVGTKLSLRYSLWDRDPTNDLEVIRFCLALPIEQYTQAGLERSIIRRAFSENLPEKVRLNQRKKGIQGADTIHRLTPHWHAFINELKALIRDPEVSELFNQEAIKTALLTIEHKPQSEIVWSIEFKVITRCLIAYRFLKRF